MSVKAYMMYLLGLTIQPPPDLQRVVELRHRQKEASNRVVAAAHENAASSQGITKAALHAERTSMQTKSVVESLLKRMTGKEGQD